MAIPKLSDADIQQRLAQLPNWTRQGETIRRSYTFTDFAQAVAFVNAVAEAAEEADHHPDIDIRYNRVALLLTTHVVGALTLRDMHLAASADSAAEAVGAL